MLVKLTNCKYFTGGGRRKDAIPARIRHNQNIQINLHERYRTWSDHAIKRLVERIRKYSIITSKQTKVIRDFDSYKFQNSLYIKRRNKRLRYESTNNDVKKYSYKSVSSDNVH